MIHVEQITDDWHKATTSRGVFFGYTREQVLEKAAAADRHHAIAEAEQREFLQLNERQRGIRIC